MATLTMACNYAAIAFASALLTLMAVGTLKRFHLADHDRDSDQQQLQRLLHQVSEMQSKIDALSSSSTSSDRQLLSSQQSNCSCDLPDGFTYASDFGVVGDAAADDGPSLQAAIDSAASNVAGGGTVVLPRGVFRTSAPLVIPGGVTLRGQGSGSSPLAIQFDAGSSTIAYCGDGHAVRLAGHLASIRDLAVYDWPYTGCEDVRAAGGVLVEADQELVESVAVQNVFIYYFVGGAALSLVAKNSGGVPFGTYQNVRIRHAKTGILLSADETSFVK